MFRARLLLIIRRYCSVYTEICLKYYFYFILNNSIIFCMTLYKLLYIQSSTSW